MGKRRLIVLLLMTVALCLVLAAPVLATGEGPMKTYAPPGSSDNMPAAESVVQGTVLWDQPSGPDVGWGWSVGQGFIDQFLAMDFVNSDPWSVDTIYIPWEAIGSLFGATSLTWQIYADNGGVPDGHPTLGGNAPVWSLSLPATDPQLTITPGNWGSLSRTLLTLDTPVVLPAGCWWLVWYPTSSGMWSAAQPATAVQGYADQWSTSSSNWDGSEPLGTDVPFRLEGSVASETLILRPNGDPSPLTLLGAAPHWQMLDDDPFNDATFVYSGSSSWAIECYPIEDPPALAGEIASVKVWIRGYRAGTIPGDPVSSARTYLQIGGTDSQGDMVTLLKSPPNATNYSTTYTTNPYTGLAWTWTDINNLRAGVSLRNPGTDGSGSSGCSEVWVEVTYIPNQPPVAGDDESLDNFPGPVTLDVLCNDTDPDGNLDTASVDLDPCTGAIDKTHGVMGEGTWTEDGTGNVTFTPEAGFFGDPTPISYTVSDTCGLYDYGLITITYLRASDLKQDAWDRLDALYGTLSGSQKTYIGMARSSLTYALNPTYWIDDLHLKEAYGSSVFTYERQCLTYIRSAVTYYGLSPSEVEDIIEALVTADRLLACQAIADAIDASGSASKIATAQGYLAKADAYAAVSNWDYAVANYRNAWFYAVSAY